VTGDSYSLVEMQSGPIANNLAFIEYDLALINADHGSELVIEDLLPAVFDVFRESDAVADCQRDLLSLEHTEFPCLVEWQLLLGDGCQAVGGVRYLLNGSKLVQLIDLRRPTFKSSIASCSSGIR
jgi:hypothetical protein